MSRARHELHIARSRPSMAGVDGLHSSRSGSSTPGSSDSRSSTSGSSTSGRVPLWIPCALLIAGLVWLFDGISQGVHAAGFERIDPRSSRLDVPGHVDPRWNDLLRQRMAALPPISPHDRAGVERIAALVASLPFVAQVGEPSVLWPDGVDVPLQLRRPAACVLQGGGFLAVAEDGTILPGRWPTPTWVELLPGDGTSPPKEGFLPVIGPNDGAFDLARAGDRLTEARHLDALAVALSMRAALCKDDYELLGPPLIDATNARSASVEVPGVVIRFENRRTVWFGRAPGSGAVGERPVDPKWADVHTAALRLRGLESNPPRPEARDWSLLDVRWDTADITWRDPDDVQQAAAPTPPKKKK
jgi:hypothetical protein